MQRPWSKQLWPKGPVSSVPILLCATEPNMLEWVCQHAEIISHSPLRNIYTLCLHSCPGLWRGRIYLTFLSGKGKILPKDILHSIKKKKMKILLPANIGLGRTWHQNMRRNLWFRMFSLVPLIIIADEIVCSSDTAFCQLAWDENVCWFQFCMYLW